jgi:hypothetical protein
MTYTLYPRLRYYSRQENGLVTLYYIGSVPIRAINKDQGRTIVPERAGDIFLYILCIDWLDFIILERWSDPEYLEKVSQRFAGK